MLLPLLALTLLHLTGLVALMKCTGILVFCHPHYTEGLLKTNEVEAHVTLLCASELNALYLEGALVLLWPHVHCKAKMSQIRLRRIELPSMTESLLMGTGLCLGC